MSVQQITLNNLIVGFWEILSTPLLPLFPDPLRLEVVVSVSVQSIGQIEVKSFTWLETNYVK